MDDMLLKEHITLDCLLKGVLSHFKALMQADDEILDTFTAFGQTQDIPSHIFDKMERYVCVLYRTGDLNERFVRELRWALFAQKGKEGQQATAPSDSGNISSTHFKGILYGSSLEIIKHTISSASITYRLLMGIHKWLLETNLLSKCSSSRSTARAENMQLQD